MSKKIGLLLRSFAKTGEEVSGVVERATKSIQRAASMRYHRANSMFMFESIVVVVPGDFDCGTTATEIKREARNWFSQFEVLTPNGHHSCEALNEGVKFLAGQGIDYVVIISNKAIEAMNETILSSMLEAFDNGAKVVGVAVDELRDVVGSGRVQNTFAGWDIKAFLEVGGFDSSTGVEEIAPSVRLIQKYGPCVAALLPSEVSSLNIRKSVDGEARHKEVMTTKLDRQEKECERLGIDFKFIESGIMTGYPQTV